MLEAKISTDELKLENISAHKAFQSQEAGFRHRRQGLSYRLSKRDFSGGWKIQKRIAPGEYEIARKYQRIFSQREEVIPLSLNEFQKAKKAGTLRLFQKKIERFHWKYKIAYTLNVKNFIRKVLYFFNINDQRLISARQWLKNKFSK